MAPAVVARGGDVEAVEQGALDPVVAPLQREPHLAGEAGVGPGTGVEGGVAEPRGGGGQADVGGGGQGGEERLFGGAGELALAVGAELEPAVAGANRPGFGDGFGG